MHRPRVLLLAIIVLLHLCATQDIPCTGTQNNTGTFYRAQWNGSNCQCAWISNDHCTIANHKNKSKEVISYSNTTLFISGCYPEVTLLLDCTNQGEWMQHTANCTVTCSESTPLTSKGTRKRWPLAVSVLCFIVAVAIIWRIREK